MHPRAAAGRVGNPAGQELAELLPAGFPTRPAARSRPLSTRPARPAPGPVRPAAGPVRPAAGPVRPATSAAAQPLGRPAPRTPAVHQPQGPACGGSRSHGPRKPVDHSRNIKATRRGPEWLPEEPFMVGAMTTTADHPVHSRVEHDAGEPLVDRTAAAVDCSPELPVVPSLSPSRAADFMTCPLLFRFRTIDRLPERPSAQAARGTVVHAVLERLFDLPRPERTLAAAVDLVEPQWLTLLGSQPELAELVAGEPGGVGDWLNSAGELLAGYFHLEDPSRLEHAEREHYVETTLSTGLRLRGYIDRLDETSSGDVRVVDYKTGRAPAEAFEVKALFQMRFYALVVWRLSGRVPRLLQLMYLGDREVLRYVPDEADLRATERKIVALW